MDYEFEKWVTDVIDSLVTDVERLTYAVRKLLERVEELENGKKKKRN